MTTRYYSSVATETTLVGGISAVNTSMQVQSVSGLPIQYPYVMAVDYEGATEELVEVTGAAGTTLNINRAYDGTPAAAHNTGARVRHVSSAQDFRDSRNHENATSGVHGVVGDVVGTTDTQSLTNKTITGGTITGTVGGTPDFSDRVDFLNGITTTDDGAGVPFRVVGGPTQTASLVLVENNAGTDLVRVDASGTTLFSQAVTMSSTLTVTGTVAASNAATVGTDLTVGTFNGVNFTGSATINGDMHVGDGLTVSTTSNIDATLDVQKAPGQTSNLQEWSFGGTALAAVNSFGEAGFARRSATGASVFTALAGWSVLTAIGVETAGIATVLIVAQRTGADIVVPANGDLPGVQNIGTLDASWRPNALFTGSDFPLIAENSIGNGGATMPPSTGILTLRSWSGEATIATGNNIAFRATFVT